MSRLSSWQRFLPVTLLLAATAFFLEAHGSAEVLPKHEKLSAFPIQILNWHGRDIPLAQETLDVLGPGDFLSRNYESSLGEAPIDLFIAFFPSQRAGDTIHSPKNCLPGSGWLPVESSRIPLKRLDGSNITINYYLIGKGADQDIVLYWYQAHGHITPSEYWAKIYLVNDAIRLNRTDGALVRVITPVLQGEDRNLAEARVLGFAQALLPVLDGYIPR